ncbi:replication protein o [Escherichia coli]|nr:replication protein o [Escherichia coli]
MTNTAKILNFGRGNFAGQERNVADLDDGYARLSNMLLEAYSGADLTKRQFKVLLAILRRTYGWNKPMDRITDSQLSEITKLPVKRCNEAKLELVRMNIPPADLRLINSHSFRCLLSSKHCDFVKQRTLDS